MPTTAGLYYFVHGENTQNRPPVLLLHGAGGTHLSWPPQLRRLSGHRVYTLDLPGHGKSKGVGGQEVEEYSKSVIEFMKSLRLSTVVVVGFSMGSAIALSLALRYPKRFLALGLIGCGAKMRVAPLILELAANPSTFLSTIDAVIEYSYSSTVDPRVKELARQQMAEIRPAVLHGDFLACNSFDMLDRVKKIRIPTLLICGSADQMTPLNRSEYLRDQIKGSRLQVVEKAGHMVMIEQPDQVAEQVSAFLDEILY